MIGGGSSGRHEVTNNSPRRPQPFDRVGAADGSRWRAQRAACRRGGRVLLLLHRRVSLRCGVLQSRPFRPSRRRLANCAGGWRRTGSGSAAKLRNDPGHAATLSSQPEDSCHRSAERIAPGDRFRKAIAGLAGDSCIRRRNPWTGQPARPPHLSLASLTPGTSGSGSHLANSLEHNRQALLLDGQAPMASADFAASVIRGSVLEHSRE